MQTRLPVTRESFFKPHGGFVVGVKNLEVLRDTKEIEMTAKLYGANVCPFYQLPATVIPSILIVGALVPYRKTKSSATVKFWNISAKFPAMVTSVTG